MLGDKLLFGAFVAWVISAVALNGIADGAELGRKNKTGQESEGSEENPVLERDHHLYNASFFVAHIFEKYGDRSVLTYEGFEHLLENLGLGRLNFEKGHDISLHKVNGSFYEIHDEKDLHRHWHEGQEEDKEEEESKLSRSKRHSPSSLQITKHETDVDGAMFCLSPQEILLSYGMEPSHGVTISPANFQLLCPAIVYELDQKHCWDGTSQPKILFKGRQRLVVWLEAGIAILIMSVAGLLCAAVVPILNRCDDSGAFLHFLVAIAAGTLAGDAVIHLLPQVLTQRSPSELPSSVIQRGTVTLLSILMFFIAECLLLIIYKKRSKDLGEKPSAEAREMINHPHSHSHSRKHKEGPLACVVIAGDILHNVTDGLSIGAAFSMSRGAGLACATAVFCHELPHELGDYAVLLREGMRIRQALLCNLFSSVFSFIGMSVGILLGEFMDATPWINAFTAGSFLYIALANLIPELKSNSNIAGIISQLCGLLSGILLMFFIALYEHDWEEFIASED